MRQSALLAFLAGAAVGVLGELIGLGGAEFRLPLLIGVFGLLALQAVILNKAMSLIVVLTALPVRLISVLLLPARRQSRGLGRSQAGRPRVERRLGSSACH